MTMMMLGMVIVFVMRMCLEYHSAHPVFIFCALSMQDT